MIVSFKHNYIYFRPKKTGSSTIEAVLGIDLGPDDIMPGDRVALRITRDKNATSRFGALVTHAKADKIRSLVPEEFWNRCYKFASERHPYEKAVSLAFYRLHKFEKWGVEEEEKQFPYILDEVVRSNAYSGIKYYSIGEQIVAQDFIRHESFETDLRRVAARVGVALPPELPKKKHGMRLDTRPARDILSDDQKRIIRARCEKEFALLGYEP